MKTSGQTIVNYFAMHFAFFESLFLLSKKDNFFIANDTLSNLCNAENTKNNGNTISLHKLETYKIVKPLPDGNYEINKRFVDFISFLIDDFRLDLPESIKKHQNSIEDIYRKITVDNLTINQQHTTNTIIRLTNGLMNDIQEFGLQIESNTSQLFIETTEITKNKGNLSYPERIQKATYLIENYIKPLNNILNKEHTNSFIKLLSKISDFANLQRHEQNDFGLSSQFQQLYQRIRAINGDILKSSSIMAKNVTPLLDRLRSESEVLRGVESFLVNAKRGKVPKKLELYEIKGKRSRSVYSKNIELDVEDIFALLRKPNPINLLGIPEQVSQDLWVFDREKYREAFFDSLPLDDFFGWCYQVLCDEASSHINAEKFYFVSSLIFERNIQVSFSASERHEIELEDYLLKVPKVTITHLSD